MIDRWPVNGSGESSRTVDGRVRTVLTPHSRLIDAPAFELTVCCAKNATRFLVQRLGPTPFGFSVVGNTEERDGCEGDSDDADFNRGTLKLLGFVLAR